MADFNFFEPFLEPPVKQNYTRLLWLVLYGILLIAITYLQVDYMSEKAVLESDINAIRTFVTSEPVVTRMADIREKEQAYQALSAISQELGLFETLLQLKGQLQVGLFDQINQKVPEYVYVNALNMTSAQVVISGYSDSYESIALFQHQLRGVDKFAQVFVPSIVEDQGNYVFTINAVLKVEVPSEN